MKPVIGLVSKHNVLNGQRTYTYISDEMKNAIFYNGGVAIGIIPSMVQITFPNKKFNVQDIDNLFTIEEKENLISQIKMCDGIILSGGPKSDVYEIWIAKYCYDNNIPILGICAGHNNIVRSVGGTIKEVENAKIHYQPNLDYVHSIKVNKNSNFYNFVKRTKMNVNSRHRNIIDNSSILSIVAYDEYGNIEVTEDKTKKCFIGMRFHPESLYLVDETHNNIFKKFIEICQ